MTKIGELEGYCLTASSVSRTAPRIVAKIEELFSELDRGVESLKTARAQLHVYRQAVLKHAFEGKLTAQWREENKNRLEEPERLLARIKRERAARYARQLKEWQDLPSRNGKVAGKSRQASRASRQDSRAESPKLDDQSSSPNLPQRRRNRGHGNT